MRIPSAMPGAASGDVTPNHEFDDLWLRFVSSVADQGLTSAMAQRIDLSAVVSRYIGETEKNLDAVFGRADRAGATLLLDESDALLGRRTEVRDSHDRYADPDVDAKGDPDPLRHLRAMAAFPVPPR